MSVPTHELQRALRLRAQARFADALAVCDELVRRHPAWAAARETRGLVLCHLQRFDEGLAEIRAAVAAEPRNADFLCDLGFLAYVDDRQDEARTALEAAIALAPAHAMALANLSLVRRSAGDFGGAEAAARGALAADPARYEARINLALALLAQGRFQEGWAAYAWRPAPHVNLRDPHLAAHVPHAQGLPPPGAPVVIHGEQGLGDTLFFLRFAPALAARGHRLAFWGDARLHGVLAGAGVFEKLLAPEAMPAEGLAVLWAAELPWLLEAHDPARFPPPLPLKVDAGRSQGLREHLSRLGPPPYVGLTWRAGLERRGRVALAKSLDGAALARALRGAAGTFLALQRGALPGEVAQVAQALGANVHDAGPVLERLDDAFTLCATLDEYVAVSNTNVHLRASAGRASRVLVPWPPEWRWAREPSPWFPRACSYRQASSGSWDAALAALRADLGAA